MPSSTRLPKARHLQQNQASPSTERGRHWLMKLPVVVDFELDSFHHGHVCLGRLDQRLVDVRLGFGDSPVGPPRLVAACSRDGSPGVGS